MDDRRFRILILGAGFSRLAGFPLGPGLWSEILAEVEANAGTDTHLHRDLQAFRDYKRRCECVDITAADLDYEQFLSFLDIEHHLGLRGSDTWSADGNESQILVKGYIGKILWKRIDALGALPQAYITFAKALRPGDIVLTYNYDTLLETALDYAGVEYRLFPYRYKEIGITSNTIDSSRDEVVVLKLHGSIDWFDRGVYGERLEVAAATAARAGLDYTPRDPVFGPDAIVAPVPLVDGPRGPNDPLATVYRVLDPSALYRNAGPLAVPLILAPSYSKILYSTKLHEFWYGMNRGGGLNLGMAIIGYSLPSHDEYIRQTLYTLTSNYTDFMWGDEMLGKLKSPLRIVDLRPTPEGVDELKKRYRFLNWKRTELFPEGFGDLAVRFLFND